MINAGLSSLDARVLLLEWRYLRINGEPNDALGSLVISDAPKEFQPGRVVFGIEDPVRTFMIIDYLILHNGDLLLVPGSSLKFAGVLALRANQTWLGASVELVVITVIHSGVPL